MFKKLSKEHRWAEERQQRHRKSNCLPVLLFQNLCSSICPDFLTSSSGPSFWPSVSAILSHVNTACYYLPEWVSFLFPLRLSLKQDSKICLWNVVPFFFSTLSFFVLCFCFGEASMHLLGKSESGLKIILIVFAWDVLGKHGGMSRSIPYSQWRCRGGDRTGKMQTSIDQQISVNAKLSTPNSPKGCIRNT